MRERGLKFEIFLVTEKNTRFAFSVVFGFLSAKKPNIESHL